ncbi:MAG TPA: FliH/SctL family protein [Polyangiaceae bacterium]|nr:FliH/SctL family protein [Polyangiaceae bacterium]
MTLPRARVLRASDAATVAPILAPAVGAQQRRRIAREEVEAHLAAERILADARAEADALLARAREDATRATADAARDAREGAQARVVAEWATLLDREREKLERDVDRVVAVAVALAERLLGAALELDPSRIAVLARGVVAEARGARRATIDAHPTDARALRDHLADAGLDPQAFDVREDESLARGALRLHTDVGVIDAQLAPRLERLAAALRDALE